MKLPSLESLFTNATITFKRFPLAIISAIVGAFYCISISHLPYDLMNSHYYYWNIVMSCYLGMLLFVGISIYCNRRKLKSKANALVQIAGIAIIIMYYFSLPPQFMTISFTRFLLFTLILHLLIAFIPFISNGEINGFWQYNKIIFLRFLSAALYTVVLYLGLILAVLAIDKLFNANIDSKIYLDLWIILSGIFNTWFFLSGLPANFEELELKKDYPKGLKIFTQYVLLPLISVYLVILYAYMSKIIFSAQWPIGWVSYLVIGFSIGGIFSLLLIYPVRNDENNKWILIFSRFFYFALFPLIILLFLAVKRRISDYGITEQRYFILVLALWLLFIAIYFLFSKSKNIKLIPVSLCLLALASSFGPWGAFSVSLSNQKQHLKSLLEKYSMLSQGKIVKAKDTIPFKDHKQISSIINYLVDVHGYKSLQPFFAQNLDSALKKENDNDYTYTKVNKIHSLMKLSYLADYQTQEEASDNMYVNYFIGKTDNMISIEGYDYFIQDFNVNEFTKDDSTCHSYLLGKNNVSICFDFKKKQLSLFSENDSLLIFDISSLIKSLENRYNNYNSVPLEEMTLISGNSGLKAKIIFDNIHFNKQKNTTDKIGFSANIFIWKL
ncbi:MAG TPA: DUF4153 domain-containing protein [Hanamia sp.]